MIKGISAGDKVELKGFNKEKEPVSYMSQIMDVSDDYTIRIGMPIVKGKIIPLPKGAKFDAFFYTSKSIYRSKIVVSERYKSGNIYTMDIVLENGIKKFQRREFYRLEKMIPMKYVVLSEEECDIIAATGEIPETLNVTENSQKGMILDISGGGIRFTGDVKLENDMKLLATFEMFSGKENVKFNIPVNIVRTFKIVNESGKYENRVKYQNISRDCRELIIKSIFEEERRKIKPKY